LIVFSALETTLVFLFVSIAKQAVYKRQQTKVE